MANIKDWETEFDKDFIYTSNGHWSVNYKGTLYRDRGLTPDLLKNFIRWAVKSARQDEVIKFMEEIQKRANTTQPNLLLNEAVDYAYDRKDKI